MVVAEVRVHELGGEVEDPAIAGVEPDAVGAGDDKRRNISLRRPVDEDVLLRIGEDLGDVGAIRGERHRSSDYTLGGDR